MKNTNVLYALLKKRGHLVCDGAMGTMLLNYGITQNCPELLNVERPEVLSRIHQEYILAGADIIETNTFGASPLKLAQFGLEDRTEELNIAAVKNARRVAGIGTLVAGDIGPLGKLLEPMGSLSFDDAYAAFARQAKALAKGGADILIIETMSDMQEMRAALIAAKENTKLPVICSFTFDKNGRTLTGTDYLTAALTCQGLGADVFCTNCGNGPQELYALLAPMKKQLQALIHIPLMIMPNAGLPVLEGGTAVYTMRPEEFGTLTSAFVDLGFSIFGGCCGTTPAHIKQTALKLQERPQKASTSKNVAQKVYFTSRSAHYVLDGKSDYLIIGERLNPTARKAFAADLKEDRTDFLKQESVKQQQEGAHLLDLNVGVPEMDQVALMRKMSATLLNACPLPVCFDSDDPKVLEVALKNYPGIALVNSVNGKEHVLESVLPLVKRYGASVIALALDEKGIPGTVDGRMKIVKRIVRTAEGHGVARSRIFVDALVMAVATESTAAKTTLAVIKECTALGLKTSLGVSNVSFGLPQRTVINNAFLTLAVKAGLTAAIVNPATAMLYKKGTKEFTLAKNVLSGTDKGAQRYIAAMNKNAPASGPVKKAVQELSVLEKISRAVVDGDDTHIVRQAEEALKANAPQTILDALIAGIEKVGVLYQSGEYFLPQMVASANAMKKAFLRVKQDIPVEKTSYLGTVVICTVHGDIHDIGKNIVAMMLENHGFRVIDLGKDIPTAEVVKAALKEKADIVCLSALLTTTMTEMPQVKKALAEAGSKARIMVGGAVVNDGYAERIGAHYSKDAVGAVEVAKELMHEQKA